MQIIQLKLETSDWQLGCSSKNNAREQYVELPTILLHKYYKERAITSKLIFGVLESSSTFCIIQFLHFKQKMPI